MFAKNFKPRRLGFQSLEQRDLMAGDVFAEVIDGVLESQVPATVAQDDILIVAEDGTVNAKCDVVSGYSLSGSAAEPKEVTASSLGSGRFRIATETTTDDQLALGRRFKASDAAFADYDPMSEPSP